MWLKYFFGRLTEFVDQLFSNVSVKKFSPLILGIMSRWYLLICIPAITAVYYAFKGLQEKGILDKIYNFIELKLGMLVNIARYCVPQIGDLKKFIDCLNLYN